MTREPVGSQGKVEGDCFIVLDAFALPVEGTETRVNAQQEAYEYIIDFAETNKVRSLSNTLHHCVPDSIGNPRLRMGLAGSQIVIQRHRFITRFE